MFPKFSACNKEKFLPVLTLHTGLMGGAEKGGNMHMRTLYPLHIHRFSLRVLTDRQLVVNRKHPYITRWYPQIARHNSQQLADIRKDP